MTPQMTGDLSFRKPRDFMDWAYKTDDFPVSAVDPIDLKTFYSPFHSDRFKIVYIEGTVELQDAATCWNWSVRWIDESGWKC